MESSVVTVSELFGSGKYYHLRASSVWGNDQWGRFFEDVTSGHWFIGAVVIYKVSSSEYEVVADGSQRFIACSAFIAAIADRINELADSGEEPAKNRERAKILRSRYLRELDPVTLQENDRIELDPKGIETFNEAKSYFLSFLRELDSGDILFSLAENVLFDLKCVAVYLSDDEPVDEIVDVLVGR